jgi:Na+-driven multidrug efflux pump
MLALSFFTTRIVLEKLGVSDYGVNSLVGGFVASFAVLNNILSSGTSRFLALSLGRGDRDEIKATFSTALLIHVVIGFVVVLALETAGLWFMNSKLNIEPDRMYAANWVFQIAVIGTFIGVVTTPFSAAVMAHEHFNVYASLSIFDVVAKLLILYLLVVIPGDKLIVYNLLIFSAGLIGLTIYMYYCRSHFEECRFTLRLDKPLAREMLQFSGWGAFGHVITVFNSQGISIILNMFYNTVMNAARGLAGTINFVVSNFVTGFLAAAQPQLVKYYGAGDMDGFVRLIFNVTQYTLFILALMVVPVLLELDFVVNLWLAGDVPPYTCMFAKITLFCGVFYRSNAMVEDGLHAIGRVKENSMYSVPVYLISLPLVYGALYFDFGALVAYWAGTFPPLLSFLINIVLLSRYTIFPGMKYFTNIFLKNTALILLSTIVPYFVQRMMEPGLVRFLVVCTVAEICTFGVIWFWGLNKTSRAMFTEMLAKRFPRIFHKFKK